jgi:hypothetical protein
MCAGRINRVLVSVEHGAVPQKKTDSFFLKKVRGGALYVAILVSIIIGIVLTLFILIANYNQRTITVFTQSSQLYYNLRSAFEIARSDYFTEEQNNIWLKNPVNDDSVRVKKLSWGAYVVLSAETKNRHRRLSQSGLYGTFMSADTGIVVSDNSRPVGVSGAVVFKANCYLPVAGIKPAYIEGQSYIGVPQNAGFIKRSPAQVPAVHEEMIRSLKQQQAIVNPSLDSAVGDLPLNYVRSFVNKTVVWETSLTRLTGLHLGNNIKIVCGDVEVDSSAHLENVLIVCRKVRFKKGFQGRVHVIASDSVNMEEDCVFRYPSSFVLLPEDNGPNGMCYIQFNKNCKFFGGVLALNTQGNSLNTKMVLVKLAATSEINGLVYSAGYIHLEGTVHATLICNKLLLKTPSAVYENHMLTCEIDPKKYAHLLGIPQIFGRRAKLICCENMN